jgi:hypothetical protein
VTATATARSTTAASSTAWARTTPRASAWATASRPWRWRTATTTARSTPATSSFKDIKLWVDANHDGKTDAGELRGLADSGVVELNLAHVASSKTDQGNLVGLVGSYRTADGATHEMSDVWFAKQRDGAAGAAPPLAELVSAPSADLLGGGNGAGAPGPHRRPPPPPAW